MSTAGSSGSGLSHGVVVLAGRLWAGGVATGFVAGLVAVVGVLVCTSVLHLLLVPTLVLPITDYLALNYAIAAFAVALVATGLAHVLSITTPRPRTFFGWIIGLFTVASMVMPFAFEGTLGGKIGTALINLCIGISIGALLAAVLSRTVIDAERSWQRR